MLFILLAVAELGGDLIKSVAKGNTAKIKEYYKRLTKAKIVLNKADVSYFKRANKAELALTSKPVTATNLYNIMMHFLPHRPL